MFTWICPKCGREVPPAYSECPDCANTAAKAEPSAEPSSAALAMPAPSPLDAARTSTPAPVAPLPPVTGRPYAPPPRVPRSGLPTWLMTVLFTFSFVGLGAGAYWLVGYLRESPPGRPTAMVESPAAKSAGKTNPFQKYIEVSGVRFVENAKKQTDVRFVVVNHSPADLGGLTGNVTVWGRTQKSEEDAAGTFTFSTHLGPWESKEISAAFKSKLRIYELPDWQNLSTDIQITAPAASGGSPGPR